MKTAVVIGATSGMGRGLALRLAEDGYNVGVTGRRESLLQDLAQMDKEHIVPLVMDITDTGRTEECLWHFLAIWGKIDLLILCAGTGELNHSLDFAIEKNTIHTNIIGFTFVADWVYRLFERQGYGQLVILSSIAGLRGDAGAPAYNATKAYQINYAQGLRKKSVKSGLPIVITDIRPGFVDTAMAKGEGLFWITPLEKAVSQIYRAIHRKRPVVYVSKRWGCVATLLKMIPARIYHQIG